MMDEDFEYHVTFPVIAEPVVKKEPVVIIFGWAGCIDKYLTKYSEIYQKKGCTTIRYIASPNIINTTFIDVKRVMNLAEKVVTLLFDMKLDKHPIFFHTFSNGGATVYRYVSETIRKKYPNDLKIKGCIFDSCPAKLRTIGFLRATLAMTEGNFAKRYAFALFALFIDTMFALYSLILSFFTGKFNYYTMWNALAEEPNICPQLFLFSKNDNICFWDTIQEFVDYRKKKGVSVKSVLFEKSTHIKHMFVYKNEYVKHVYEFVDENVYKEDIDN